MTIKELKDNLNYYDNDAEIELTLDEEMEVDSWTENKYGMKSVYFNKRLDICFIGGGYSSPWIDLNVKEG